MATLDLSDAFDPSFLTDVLVKRPSLQLSPSGIYEEVGFSVWGMRAVVLPQSTQPTHSEVNDLTTGGLELYVMQGIEPKMQLKPADTIIWSGEEYRIDLMEDYGHYGQGFYRVICTKIFIQR